MEVRVLSGALEKPCKRRSFRVFEKLLAKRGVTTRLLPCRSARRRASRDGVVRGFGGRFVLARRLAESERPAQSNRLRLSTRRPVPPRAARLCRLELLVRDLVHRPVPRIA